VLSTAGIPRSVFCSTERDCGSDSRLLTPAPQFPGSGTHPTPQAGVPIYRMAEMTQAPAMAGLPSAARQHRPAPKRPVRGRACPARTGGKRRGRIPLSAGAAGGCPCHERQAPGSARRSLAGALAGGAATCCGEGAGESEAASLHAWHGWALAARDSLEVIARPYCAAVCMQAGGGFCRQEP
jgi:hypothetical protein